MTWLRIEKSLINIDHVTHITPFDSKQDIFEINFYLSNDKYFTYPYLSEKERDDMMDKIIKCMMDE